MVQKNSERRRIQAEENVVLDVQFAIVDLLNELGMSKGELASKLGVSKARVSQLLAAGANPTLKQLARVFDALGRRLEVRPASLDEFHVAKSQWEDISSAPSIVPDLPWSQVRHFWRSSWLADNENSGPKAFRVA
jgi:transcriptional regulator with XRE-family HTH domain